MQNKKKLHIISHSILSIRKKEIIVKIHYDSYNDKVEVNKY